MARSFRTGLFSNPQRRLSEVDVSRTELLPRRIEGVRTPQVASPETLRLCATERDAFLTSMALSGFTYHEIASRCGVTKQAVSKWKNGIPGDRVTAFCNATGTTLLRDFLSRERAMREIQHRERECDRIAHIASYTPGRAA